MRARVLAAMRTRRGSFALSLSSLLLIAAGVAVDVWMFTLPTYVRTSCTELGGGASTCSYEPNPSIQLWLGLVIAVLGVVLLAVAWRFDRRPNERPRQGWQALRAWGAPLLWLAVVPIIAAPVAYLLIAWKVREPTCQITNGWFGSWAECPVSALIPVVLVPGLLNLVPMRWLWISVARTRLAATSASVLGVAGLVGSLLALSSQGPTIEIGFGIFPPLPPPGLAGLAVGTVIWLSSLIALLVIAKVPVVKHDHVRR